MGLTCEPELGETPSVAEIWRLADGFASAMLVDGRLTVCGGVACDWPGRGTGWVLARPDLPRRAWVAALGAMRRAIAQAQVRVPTEIERPLRSNLNGDSNPI